jgi:lipopolysaccharide export system protein LptA
MRLLLSLLAAGFVGAAALRAQTPSDTTVESKGAAEFSSTDMETTAVFHDQVVAVGNGITLKCDFLQVVSTRQGDLTATLGQYGNFKTLLATGHVYILQGDREATCGRAEVFPAEDRIVLSEDPVVRYLDNQISTITGTRIILYRGQRRAVVEGPTRGVLPPMKDLGFGKPAAGAPAATPPPAGTDAK